MATSPYLTMVERERLMFRPGRGPLRPLTQNSCSRRSPRRSRLELLEHDFIAVGVETVEDLGEPGVLGLQGHGKAFAVPDLPDRRDVWRGDDEDEAAAER